MYPDPTTPTVDGGVTMAMCNDVGREKEPYLGGIEVKATATKGSNARAAPCMNRRVFLVVLMVCLVF
jgi:hypothetical protein